MISPLKSPENNTLLPALKTSFFLSGNPFWEDNCRRSSTDEISTNSFAFTFIFNVLYGNSETPFFMSIMFQRY